MKIGFVKTAALVAMAWCSMAAEAQELSMNGGKTTFAQGDEIVIKYGGATNGDKILLYHNLAMLPLKEKGTATADNGEYVVADNLQSGDYRAALVDKDGNETAQVTFMVEEEPLPTEGHRICLLSDIHVMNLDLVEDFENSSFLKEMSINRKLQVQSYEIFCAYLDTIKALKPELLLIPGDLAKDGEILSHQLVAQKLQELLDMGIPTLVIPGNHDMENESGLKYTPAGREYTDTATPETFEQIYSNFGYKDPLARDPNSLSYVCEPIEGLRFIGIDDCRIPSRGDTKKGIAEYGRIMPETLEWVLEQADNAAEEGKVVIAAVHHQLLQHFVGQESLMETAATEHGDSIARLFADHGIRVIVTGHMHIPDVSRITGFNTDNTITEISSASTISYPSQFRVLTVSNDLATMKVNTRSLKATESLPELQRAARDKIDETLDTSISQLTDRYMSTFNDMLQDFASIPDFAHIIDDVPTDVNELAAIALEAFGETLRKVIYTHSEGNEHLKDAANAVLDQLEKDCDTACDLIFDQQNESTRAFLSYAIYGYMLEMGEQAIKSMLSDTSYLGTPMADQTDDFNLTIALKDVDEGVASPMTSQWAGPAGVYSLTGQAVGSDTSGLPQGVYIVWKGGKARKVTVK